MEKRFYKKMDQRKNVFIKAFVIILIVFISLLVLEGAMQVVYRLKHGYWLLGHEDEQYRVLFKKHPYLVAEPRPNAKYNTKNKITFSHNSLGFRGEEIGLQKKQNIKRIVALGGSSTYCIGVSDNQTWPYQLQKELGAGYEVINMGLPGYTTVEHIIQTALNLSDLSPDICIYYIGWNDLRNMHVANLRSDYSDFHGRSQYTHLLLDSLKILNHSLIAVNIVKIIKKIFVTDPEGVYVVEGTKDKFTTKIDNRALDLYRRNIRLIISLCRAQGIRPIMIPQIFNYEKLTSDKPYGWIPYIKDKDLKVVAGVYNKALQEICDADRVEFVKEVLDIRYGDAYFVDGLGHFSPYGNKEFARTIARYLKRQ